MSGPFKLRTELRELLCQRAKYLCEYCHTSERWQYVRFTADHVLPPSEGGGDDPDNLAFACFHCNRRKSDKITAIDPETGEPASLFNPRTQVWPEHFIWSADGLRLRGRTPTGRATIVLLQLNRARVLRIRQADITVGRHPPTGDSGSQ